MKAWRPVVLLLLALGLAAVEVRAVVWGFGGTVVPGTFAPCEVLLGNPDGKAVSGTNRSRLGSTNPKRRPVASSSSVPVRNARTRVPTRHGAWP